MIQEVSMCTDFLHQLLILWRTTGWTEMILMQFCFTTSFRDSRMGKTLKRIGRSCNRSAVDFLR
eukprot:6478027-Ditylum_brightwellii.AAC.1